MTNILLLWASLLVVIVFALQMKTVTQALTVQEARCPHSFYEELFMNQQSNDCTPLASDHYALDNKGHRKKTAPAFCAFMQLAQHDYNISLSLPNPNNPEEQLVCDYL